MPGSNNAQVASSKCRLFPGCRNSPSEPVYCHWVSPTVCKGTHLHFLLLQFIFSLRMVIYLCINWRVKASIICKASFSTEKWETFIAKALSWLGYKLKRKSFHNKASFLTEKWGTFIAEALSWLGFYFTSTCYLLSHSMSFYLRSIWKRKSRQWLLASERQLSLSLSNIPRHTCFWFSRGSLYRILHRPNCQIDEQQRIKMALDVV